MLIQCANCNGYFSQDEIARARPPLHTWKLTPRGAQVLQAAATDGMFHPQCPTCGQRTLVAR